MSRPRLLYLGHNLPYPPHEGALIRSYHTVRLLARSFDVTGLYFYRRGALPTEEEREVALAEMGRFGTAEGFRIPQEWSRSRFVRDHLLSLIRRRPYTHCVHSSREFEAALGGLLCREDFDIVHVDSLDLVAHLPSLEGLPLVLAHHNVESSLLRRRARAEAGPKRSYMRLQANLLEAAERMWASRVDLNVVVSREDAAMLQRLAPGAETLVIPNGVDTKSFVPSKTEPRGGLVFVGGYSWFPNRDGMEFFTEEILPLIRRAEPDVPVRWIGKAPDRAIESFAERGVEMTGYVDDIRPELAEARCVVVPLRVGGGTRLKILDAWALGKAVVSTPRGCEGLATRDGENILIGDDPADFADATVRVLHEPTLRHSLEKEGRKTAEHDYDWELLGDRMISRYSDLLER